MLRKLLVSSTIVSLALSSVVSASDVFIPNLNTELSHNKLLVKEYKERIAALEKRDKFLTELKNKNPKLYEEKPLFEETKDAYIYRIKLNGAEAKNINFKIEHHMASIEMSMKITRNDKNEYYESSSSFYQEYAIPKNVDESKIDHYIDGDYYVTKMPKK